MIKYAESINESEIKHGIVTRMTKWQTKKHSTYSQISDCLGKWCYEPFNETTKSAIEKDVDGIVSPFKKGGLLKSYSIKASLVDESNGNVNVEFEWEDSDPKGDKRTTTFFIGAAEDMD